MNFLYNAMKEFFCAPFTVFFFFYLLLSLIYFIYLFFRRYDILGSVGTSHSIA